MGVQSTPQLEVKLTNPSSILPCTKSTAQKQCQLPNTSNKALKTGMGHNYFEMTQSTLHWCCHYSLLYYKKDHQCTQSNSKKENQLGKQNNGEIIKSKYK